MKPDTVSFDIEMKRYFLTEKKAVQPKSLSIANTWPIEFPIDFSFHDNWLVWSFAFQEWLKIWGYKIVFMGSYLGRRLLSPHQQMVNDVEYLEMAIELIFSFCLCWLLYLSFEKRELKTNSSFDQPYFRFVKTIPDKLHVL